MQWFSNGVNSLMKRLKADLHLHTKEDPEDSVKYSGRELIDQAYLKGFEVLAITNHNQIAYDNYLADYARERGILLIPGAEATIGKKHVLLLNMDYPLHRIKTFDDLKLLKDGAGLIIAPHPFFPSFTSLNSKLEEHLDIFDAIEYSHCYLEKINFNKKAEDLAKKFGLPLIGTSDAHFLWQIGTTYSLIEAEKDLESVIAAIREGKVEIVTEPLSLPKACSIAWMLLSHMMRGGF
jgi:predicted metal-dependent phosphoesterase TrpH